MGDVGFEVALTELAQTPLHLHEGLECLLILKGDVEAELAGERFTLRRDDLLIVNRREPHGFCASGGNLVLTLRVDSAFLDRECGDAAIFRYDCNTAKDDSHMAHSFKLKRLLTRLLLVFLKRETGFEVEQRALLYRFLAGCIRHYSSGTALLPNTKEQGAAIGAALGYIGRNYQQNLTLSDVAGEIYMSAQYFSKYFKNKTGIGFLEYVTQVRLVHTLAPLLYTKDSILKIAVENGFASAKAFSVAFRRRYGTAPGEYRKAHRPASPADARAGKTSVNVAMEDKVLELLRYMKMHDIHYVSRAAGEPAIRVDVQTRPVARFEKQEILVVVANLYELLEEEVVGLLRHLRNTPGCESVFVSDFTLMGMWQPDMPPLADTEHLFTHYNAYNCVNSIRKIGLSAFFCTDLSKLRAKEGSAAPYLERLSVFLQQAAQQFPSSYLGTFKFSLGCSSKADLPFFAEFYTAVRTALRRWDIAWQTGVDIPAWGFQTGGPFAGVLSTLARENGGPRFASFKALPAGAMAEEAQENSGMRHYHAQLARAAAAILTQAAPCNLYMTQWNTLAGSGAAEAGAFFRSALLVDSLLQINGLARGVGIYPSSYYAQRMLNNSDYGVLSFFFLHRIKRPIYFMLQALGRMEGEILFQTGNLLATRQRKGEYALLLYKPQYIPPLYSVDSAFVEQQMVTVQVECLGMEAGLYQVKRYIYDRESAGIFSRWSSAGMSDLRDPDVTEHLENVIQPNFSVWETAIQGSCTLEVELSFNGIALYLLRKIK